MADNVDITAGTGTTVATDQVGTVHYQRVKLVDGTLDSTTAIPGDAANGLDVDVTRVQGTVNVADGGGSLTVDGTVTANAGTGFPAVATDGSAVVTTGQMTMGTDGTNAQTIRVTPNGDQYVWVGGDDGAGNWQSASFDATLTDAESNAVAHLNVHSRGAIWNPAANAGAGGWDRVRGDTTNGMDVDVTRVSGNVTVVQPTGSNLNAVVSGTVTANLAAGTNNIGDVDVLTVPAPLNVTGGGTEASALRVTLANNSTGVLAVTDNGTTLSVDDNGTTLSVDDGGGILTVDGTVIVTQATAGNLNATVAAGSGFPTPATAGQTASTTGPQLMGSDGTLARAVQTTTGGILKVDGSAATQPVSGTVTVSQATAGNLNATVTGTVGVTQATAANLNATVVQATASNLNATVVQGTAANLKAQVDVRDGAGNALTSAVRGSERALSVQIVDGSGAQISSFGGGTQYVEDAASAGGETGNVLLGVRNDAAATKTSADGDFSAIATDPAGRVGIADLGGSITVDGTVTANAGIGNFTVVQATAGNLNATVTGTVASTQSGTWSTRTQDGSGNALTSAVRGGERALSVQIVDGSGTQITSFGGGTQYVEDAASAGGETGNVLLGVRNDAAATKTSADGDFSAIATDSAGRVGIADLGGSITVDGSVTANAGTGFGIATVGSAASTTGPQIMGSDGTNARAVQTTAAGVLKVDGTATTQPVSGTVTASQATAANLNATVVQGTAANLKAQVDLRDGSGNAITSALRGATERALSVQILDGAGAQITSFGGGTQYVEDDASAGGETGTVLLGIRNDAAATKTSADGDFSAIATDSAGRIGIADLGGSITVDGTVTANAGTGSFTVAQATAANLNATVTGTVTVTQATAANLKTDANVTNAFAALTGSGTQTGTLRVNVATDNVVGVDGDVAHGTTDSGNPLKFGAKTIAHGAAPTAVAAGARTDLYANRHGVLFTMGGHPNIQTIKANYTGTQTGAVLVTVGAAQRIVVTRVSVLASNANTVNPSVAVGTNTTTTLTNTDTMLSHPGLAPGSGVVEGNGAGILAIGALDADLRFTCTAPTGGSLDVVASYYLIES
jgi:hypothetical protein